MTEEGSAGRRSVKLLDFGIAKQLEELDASSAPTQTVLRLMTPAYAAPEQFRGEPVALYTDVYALGVLLYELLAGAHPYDLAGLTAAQVERAVLESEPERPSSRRRTAERARGAGRRTPLDPQGWADLDVLCLTAMHKDPQRRYPTVEALLRVLDHYLRGKPLEVRPDRWRYRAGKFLRRNRRTVTAASVALTAVITLAVVDSIRMSAARDAALAEAQKAEQISDYLIGLFEAASPYAGEPDSLNVRVLLQRGIERAEALDEQPAVQAQMLDVLGRVHTLLSDYERAEELLRRALDLRRGVADGSGDVAETLSNLGVLYRYTGEYDRAEAALREALAIRERVLPPRHPDLATNLDELGVVLNNRGKHEESEALYRLALGIRRTLYGAPHPLLGHSLNNLAVNQFEQGDYAGAERYYREALEVDRAVYGPEHPNTAVDLANLGVLLETRGNYVAADSMLTEALRIKRQRLGEEHYETAFSLTQLGGMLRRKGDLDRAEAHLREALRIEARILAPHHRNTGVTLNHLATTLQEKGDHAAADSLFRRALEVFTTSVGAAHPFAGIVRCHLAYVLHLQGRGEEAERHLRAGLEVLAAALPADHDMIALNESKFGELLTAGARFSEAEPLRAKFGDGHPDTRHAARRLLALYDAWDRPGRAAELRQVLAAGEEGR